MSDDWFYGQNGLQRGPVELSALEALARAGQLQPTDLVWREGMAEWLAASAALPELFIAPPPPRPAAPVTTPINHLPPLSPAVPQPSPSPPTAPLPYQAPAYVSDPQNARAVTSLCLGIASLATCLCPFIGVGLGIAAIVLGAGVKPGPSKGLAVGGLVCGIIGVVIGLPQSGNFLFHL